MRLLLDNSKISDYSLFLKIKSLPKFKFCGRVAEFPDEYAVDLGIDSARFVASEYTPSPYLFDYQRDISSLAIRKGKYAVFADCGLGKTAIIFEFARHAASNIGTRECVLIVSPLMVIGQTIAEAQRFYGGKLPIRQVHANELNQWLANGEDKIGIVNYEALTDEIQQGRLGALILDESSLLKSHYGKWGQKCIQLGKGLRYKLALTGTPAPNDRIEYANHAVFLDQFPTVNSFLARYFVNRGETSERWELKPHALRPFYKSLSHWCIFLTNPATYGWKDNSTTIPPIHVHIDKVDLTHQQAEVVFEKTGALFADKIGGIGSRSVLSQIAKGNYQGESIATNKPDFIKMKVNSWPDESTIIWCKYNAEQETMARTFPDAANISGDTEYETRVQLIEDFKAGRRKVLISKPKILGFGLNLQIATRQVFSGLQDSYEEFYQAVKRSNRVGSTRPLNVHIPVTEIERPMIETVMVKAKRIQADTEMQEKLFKEFSNANG